MSTSRYGTFLDSLDVERTELRSVSEPTEADEVWLCVKACYKINKLKLLHPPLLNYRNKVYLGG